VVARLERSVTGDDERWNGLVLYTAAYAVFTAVAMAGDAFRAGAALLAVSLGDGIGGAIGRAFGTHHYRAPGGKQKSFEGSLVVGLGAVAGTLVAAELAGEAASIPLVFVIGVVAACAEGISPRGTDNLVIPAAVYTTAHLVT
jgi:dolichol kinase